jgi:carbamoyltransferase
MGSGCVSMIVMGVHLEHDAGAVLMKDGEVVINVEAERITGLKHADGILHAQAAVHAAFAQSGIRPEEVSAIAYSDLWSSQHYPARLDRDPAIQVATHGPDLVARRGSFAETGFDRLLPGAVAAFRPEIPVFLVCHSMSHAAGAVYMAGFPDACGLVFDAYGTCCGMMAYRYNDGTLNRLEDWLDRYLMGAAYTRIGRVSKEIHRTPCLLDVAGKVMGLQAYGKPVADWSRYFRENFFASSAATGYDDYLRGQQDPNVGPELFSGGLPPGSRSVDDPEYRDLVASMQDAFTKIVTESIDQLITQTNSPNVFMSGGCAMNIVANAAAAACPKVSSLFVQPNCGDTGMAMGAAVLAMRAMTGMPLHRPETALSQRRDPYIGAALLDSPARVPLPAGISRRIFDWTRDLPAVARRLITGEIIGFVHGRSEIGPRALGNRSILAHASFPNMQEIINNRVKHREWWRPFAPVCRLADACTYFEMVAPSRYMLMNDVVREEWRDQLAAVTHIDGTTRVQVLEGRDDNPPLWDLLAEIEAQGAAPVLLNTSFNLSGRPLVNRALEVLQLLTGSDMNAAIVAGFIFDKETGQASG